jgi:hypothetical protein
MGRIRRRTLTGFKAPFKGHIAKASVLPDGYAYLQPQIHAGHPLNVLVSSQAMNPGTLYKEKPEPVFGSSITR